MERLGNVPKVTQQVRGRAGVGPQMPNPKPWATASQERPFALLDRLLGEEAFESGLEGRDQAVSEEMRPEAGTQGPTLILSKPTWE